MQSKYQKYYSALKGKDLTSPLSGYRSALSNVENQINNINSTINSSVWEEKGMTLLKEKIIPKLEQEEKILENGIDSLTKAVSKINSLESKLNELENACYALNNCSEDNKSIYQSRVYRIENEIEGLINEINSIEIEEYEEEKETIVNEIDDLSKYTDIQKKKQAFLGSLDDDSWSVDPTYANKAKELLLFDNTTGEILKEGDLLNLKVGETRVLTVRIPHNAGHVKEVKRTSAGGEEKFINGRVVKAKSDINPDPNVVDYVNYKQDQYHIPEGVDLKTISYDWIITATEPGEVQISQTCEYTVEENNGMPKAMVDINVNVSA